MDGGGDGSGISCHGRFDSTSREILHDVWGRRRRDGCGQAVGCIEMTTGKLCLDISFNFFLYLIFLTCFGALLMSDP
jgi:hypothetical protein